MTAWRAVCAAMRPSVGRIDFLFDETRNHRADLHGLRFLHMDLGLRIAD